MSRTLADLERGIGATMRFARNWCFAGTAIIVLSAAWILFSVFASGAPNSIAVYLLLLGGFILVSAMGYLSGFYRCIRFYHEVLRVTKAEDSSDDGN